MNKKRLFPILLVFLTVASVYMMIDTRRTAAGSYDRLVEEARTDLKNGISAKAEEKYLSAYESNPSLSLALEIGDLYIQEEEYYEADRWYENTLLQSYPREAASYLFGIDAAIAAEDYGKAFQVYDSYKKRKLDSDDVEKAVRSIAYTFNLSGSYSDVGVFGKSTGIAPVVEDELWEYIDTQAYNVTSAIYTSAGNFTDVAPVVDKDGTAFFIDSDGEKAITAVMFEEKDPDFGTITQFAGIGDNLVLATNGSEWNYYDRDTCEKKFGGYTAATLVVNGLGAVSTDGDTWALIDDDGNELTGFDFQQLVTDERGTPCRTDAVIVEAGNQYYLYSKKGKRISDTAYDQAYAFYDDDLAAVKKGDEYLFVDDTGKETDLGDFQEARSFSNGLAAVEKGNKWGYIDASGNIVIDYQFEEARAMSSHGTAFVKVDDRWKVLALYSQNHDEY